MLLNASLIYAVKNGQILQADDFLKRGAEPDAADGDGMTALMHAALLGNRELVDLMITHHADVNAMDNNGMTALMQAAWAGHEEVVDDLLVAGAMLDLKNESSYRQDHQERGECAHCCCHRREFRGRSLPPGAGRQGERMRCRWGNSLAAGRQGRESQTG